MQYNYSTRRRVANALRDTPFYPTAKAVYRHVLKRQYFLQRKRLIQLFSSFVKAGDLVFDVGANVGDFADVFLNMGAKVCAFEPNPFCICELKALYARNPNFILIDKALGGVEGKNTLYLGDQGLHNVSTLSLEWKEGAQKCSDLKRAGWDKTVEVDVTTLDQLIKNYGIPTFCKIDVEGFEYEVLRGLSQPVPCISLEYTPWRIAPAIQCIEYLSELGYYKFNITMSESRDDVGELCFEDWLERDQIIDLLNRDIHNTSIVGDLYARVML